MATFPSSGKVALVSTGLTSDLDLTYGLLQSILGPVVLPSGDTSGATDGAAINAAVSTYNWFQVVTGDYYFPVNTVVLDAAKQQFGSGLGEQASRFHVVGNPSSGAGITIKNTAGTYNGTTQRAGLRRLSIDGTGSTGSASGIQAGDSARIVLDSVAASNFTGASASGFHFLNSTFWTEQLTGTIYAANCTKCVNFDVTGTGTGSFERPDLTIYASSFSGQDMVQLTGTATVGAFIIGGRLQIYGNTSASATDAILRLAAPGTSFPQITNCNLNIAVENDQAGTGPVTIKLTAAQNQIINCYGVMHFLASAGAFTASSPTSSVFRYQGYISGDTSLGTTTIQGNVTVAPATTGGTFFPQNSSVIRYAPAGNATGMILQAGSAAVDGRTVTIINASAFSIAWNTTPATSHVATAATDTIAANTSATYVWDNATALWYRM